MMQKAFGNECMRKTRIKEWYNRFKGGCTSVDSDSRSGRPSTRNTLDNIDRVQVAIDGDRQLTVRELENDLAISKTTVWEISNKILGMTRVCAVTGFFTTITRQRIHRILWLLAVSKTQKTTRRTVIRWQNDVWILLSSGDYFEGCHLPDDEE